MEAKKLNCHYRPHRLEVEAKYVFMKDNPQATNSIFFEFCVPKAPINSFTFVFSFGTTVHGVVPSLRFVHFFPPAPPNQDMSPESTVRY